MIKFYLVVTIFFNTVFVFANSNIEQRVSTNFRPIDDFSTDTVLILEKVKNAPYYIEFLFNEIGINQSKPDYNEIIKFVVILKDGEKSITKDVTLKLSNGDLGEYFLLFEPPKDFKRKSKITIEIVDVKYSEELKNYYDKLRITVRKYSKYFR